MKKALLTTILLCVTLTVAAQTMVVQTRHNHGLKGPVHIVQTAWFYDTGDGYAIGVTEVEVFDTAGRLLHTLEMSQDGLDDNTHYTYDGLGRLLTETYSTHEPYTDTYHYNIDGRMAFIVRKFVEAYSQYDDTMTVEKYDSQGRPVELKTNGRLQYYQYWPNGEIKHKSEPDTKYNAYYNECGQLDSVIAIAGRFYNRYNEKDDLVSEDNYTSTAHFHSDYTYDFIDKHGNWTERTVKSEGDVNSFSRRTIIYYE